MEIFVGNLPKQASADDLQKLVKTTLQKSLFQKVFNVLVTKGSLDRHNASFKVIQKESFGVVSNYGHVDIQSDKLARCVIDALNRIRYQGQPLVAREYVHRAYINDRRNLDWREQPWSNEERRLVERRRAEEYFWGL